MKFKVTGIIAENGELFIDYYVVDNDFLTVKELVKLLAIDGVYVLRMDEIDAPGYKHTYTADYFTSWENFYTIVKTFGDSGKRYNDGVCSYIRMDAYGDTIYYYSPSVKEFYSVYCSIGD